jgi:hypothetical protein
MPAPGDLGARNHPYTAQPVSLQTGDPINTRPRFSASDRHARTSASGLVLRNASGPIGAAPKEEMWGRTGLWIGSTAAIRFVAGLFVGSGSGAEVDIIAYLTSPYFGLRACGPSWAVVST